jgi:hypothetical protein
MLNEVYVVNHPIHDIKADKVLEQFIGEVIKNVWLDEDLNELFLEFDNGNKLELSDQGQSCCETRYMRTDDNLNDYIGAKFLGLEVKDAPEVEDDYGTHEVQFLEIQTSKGVFTMANHNEHNGYYGGFLLCVHCDLAA